MKECCCREKKIPRSEEEVKTLKNRIHRIIGQLNGIEKMIDENRYCGDILIQVAAVEKALENVGYAILQNHLETCVRDGVKEDDEAIMSEVIDLVKKLK
ncbi:MAG: metal-sensing transcriptional repressor [Holdemanella sp.]|nr:metal-sensing transcriptional repressor [Holdemanella sp.]